MSLFEDAAETPYRNRDALKDKFVPDEIVGRETEKSAYANALKPVLNGNSPDNVFLIGPSGVGKTALTRYVLDDLKNNSDDGLTIQRVNCDGMGGETTLMLEIANEFRDPGDKLATTGYKKARARDLMFQELNRAGGTVLLVLDELDTIEELDTFLYQVPRAHETGKVDEELDVGIIGISNDPSFLDELPDDVQKTLTDVPIHFSEYDASELCDVLAQRAPIAFKDTTATTENGEIEVDSDVVTKGVITRAAAFATKHSGDARMGISLLRNAADLARDEGLETVTEDHVDRALEAHQTERVTEMVERLEETAKVILYALVSLNAERRQDTPAPRTEAVRQRYVQLHERMGHDPVSGRQVRKHLAKMENMGLIQGTKNKGGGSGTFTEWAVNFQPSIIMEAIEGVVQKVGAVESVTDLVTDVELADGD